MEIRRRWSWKNGSLRGRYEFRDADDVVSSPTYFASNYANKEKISGLSVYMKRRLKRDRSKRYLWKFRKGVLPKEALLGMIVITEPQYREGIFSGRRFNSVVEAVRRDINL